ncbi:Ca2+-dependent phosphoinositide-specific phospholipase C [Streptomyces gibsoniae]|uniref:Ca2+-dependent phosphoinositide-specific phospholipase C n=1 Tax=Streptomyces gibsoniae TaxID=3075529 RepID=A0ABU2U076_9ACTN|nr:Ca2+-dependent phosphoinositide-specific phospholipase C [Streptomyces sp. DSM 41699]MDT0466624.1 Ca2+-dependent phosphoinositide-specific phospholipase C [Streptomyces sp. DSM 41699]
MPFVLARTSAWRRKACVLGAALLLSLAALPWTSATSSHAATANSGTDTSAFDDVPLNQLSVSGLHNAYEQAKSRSLTKGLDLGAHLLEIDTYSTYGNPGGWVVSHSDPLANDNNCTYTTGSGVFKKTWENGSLRTCLDDLRTWSDAHPDHDPVYLKLELKWGFRSGAGMGPAQLDQLVAKHLGADHLFTPADMLGTAYSTLDEAAKAGAWPTWKELRGKFIVFPITGTIENRLAGYDLDNLSTEEEYAQYVADLAARGQLAHASMWPAMTKPSPQGDPRLIYSPTLRPWFVIFDTQATRWLNDGYSLSWYCGNHYLTVEGSAESVSPAHDDTNPDPVAAAQRVQYLAQQGHSSITTFDWMNTPDAFALWPRDC